MRFVRPAVLGTIVIGIVLALVSGWSFASQPVGQVGYGAPQQIPDQVISGQHASSSHVGMYIALLVAFGIIAATGFFGWKKTHSSTEYP